MSAEARKLESEWIEATAERDRLTQAVVDAWQRRDQDLVEDLQYQLRAARARRKAIDRQFRELVDTHPIALSATAVTAACGLLGWTTEDLAQHARMSFATAQKAEQDGTAGLRPVKMANVRNALEAAGVDFTTPEAPKLRGQKPGASG